MEDAMTAAPREIDPKFRNFKIQLMELGFVPGLPTYEIANPDDSEPQREPLTIEMLRRALFEGTYSKPIVLPLSYHPVDELDQPLPMTVELAQAIYTPLFLRADNRPVGCDEHPSWYLRGYLYKSPFDATVETVRMHVHLMVNGENGEIETITVQLIHQATIAEADAPLLPEGRALQGDES